MARVVLLLISCAAAPVAGQENDLELNRVLAGFKDADADARVNALREVAEFGQRGAAAADSLLVYLDDPEAAVRREAVWTLAALEARQALPRIEQMLAERDVALLEAGDGPLEKTVICLAKFGAGALPVLAAVAKQGSKGFSPKTIDRFDRAKVLPLAEDDSGCDLRREACVGLGKLRDARGATVLMRVLTAAERMRPAEDLVGQAVEVSQPKPWGQRQTRLVEAILVALGEIESDDPQIARAIKKHARRFPVQADTALRKIERRNPPEKKPVIAKPRPAVEGGK